LNSNQIYSYVRFPKYNNNIESLEGSLNNYFKVNPYKKWFNSFEPFLNGLECSYYDSSILNSAVHTDICSPLPTDPTWTKLPMKTRQNLFETGYKLWEDLIVNLKPDLVVISIAKKYLDYLNLRKICNVYSLTVTKDGILRKKPYELELYELEIQKFKTKLVYGNAANMPFGTVSNNEKLKMGVLPYKFPIIMNFILFIGVKL